MMALLLDLIIGWALAGIVACVVLMAMDVWGRRRRPVARQDMAHLAPRQMRAPRGREPLTSGELPASPAPGSASGSGPGQVVALPPWELVDPRKSRAELQRHMAAAINAQHKAAGSPFRVPVCAACHCPCGVTDTMMIKADGQGGLYHVHRCCELHPAALALDAAARRN